MGTLFLGLDYRNGTLVMTFAVSSQLHASSPRGLIWCNLHHTPSNVCWQLEPKDIIGLAHAKYIAYRMGLEPWPGRWPWRRVNTSAKVVSHAIRANLSTVTYVFSIEKRNNNSIITKQEFNHYRITIHALLSVIHTLDLRCQLSRLVENCSITHNLWKVGNKDLPKKYGKLGIILSTAVWNYLNQRRVLLALNIGEL